MDKKTFYSELQRRLKDLGVPSEYVEKHISQFDKYFEGKSNEQISAEIDSLGDLDRVASRIKRATDKILLAQSGIPVEEPEQVTVEEPASDKNDKNVSGESGEEQLSEEKRVQLEEHKKDAQKQLQASRLDDETIKERLLWFRIAFFASLPLVFVILLITALLFGVVYFLIAILIIAAVILIGAVGVAGIAFCLGGLIFGLFTATSCLPIGLYECGIAIMGGGIALFTGVLVYNFAVRFMPWVSKMLLKFARFVFKKYRVLYIYVKKECVKL